MWCLPIMYACVTKDATDMKRKHLLWDFICVVHNVHSVREDLSRRNQLYQVIAFSELSYSFQSVVWLVSH